MNYTRAFSNYAVARLLRMYKHAHVNELWPHRDSLGMRMSDPPMGGRTYWLDYLAWDMQRRVYCKRYNYRRRKFSNHLVPIAHFWHYSHTVE